MRYPKFDAKFGDIKIECGLIHNIPEYLDVDVYLELPSEEEYLVRVTKEAGSGDVYVGDYRYSPNGECEFDDGSRVPPSGVVEAVHSILPKIQELIFDKIKGGSK